MPWAAKVPAIVQDWYLGSEAGHSLASVLMGDQNPSGHLPMTWYKTLDQCSVYADNNPRQYPGIERQDSTVHLWDIYYDEDIYVGYRYTEKNKLKPLFPFGHGLSYTTFNVTEASAMSKSSSPDNVIVTAKVTNTGKVAGAEVVQLYVEDVKASVERPLKELKDFQKVYLEPGESKTVTFSLSPRAFQFYDETICDWRSEPGKFRFHIGNSSQNIQQVVEVTR